MSVVLNDAYYNQLAVIARQSNPEMFSYSLEQFKQNIKEAGFKKPNEAWANSLKWLAGRIVTDALNNYKNPDDITDADLAKLEILRTQEGFDYFKEITIGYTARLDYGGVRSGRVEVLDYTKSFFLYLAGKQNDFTDYQTTLYQETIARTSSTNLSYDYGTHSKNHLSAKNILHVLLEGNLQPNKKKIADIVFPILAQSGYQEFVKRDHWEGPSTGVPCSLPFYSFRHPLHNAVRSGKLENVQYAVEKGAGMRTNYHSYDRSAFAEATSRLPQAGYREIAIYLLGVGLGYEDGFKLLSQSYGTSHGSSYPIQDFAQVGDLDMVLALAQANVGIPVLQGHVWKDQYTHATACGAHVGASKTEYTVSDTGVRDMISPIKHAVFNLDPQRGYSEYQNIFGKAVAFLIKENALKEKDVPKEDLTNPRFINFVYSLRRAAEEVKSRDPSFLRDTAVFTQDFADAVKAAKEQTGNFKIVYGSSEKLAPAKTRKRVKALSPS